MTRHHNAALGRPKGRAPRANLPHHHAAVLAFPTCRPGAYPTSSEASKTIPQVPTTPTKRCQQSGGRWIRRAADKPPAPAAVLLPNMPRKSQSIAAELFLFQSPRISIRSNRGNIATQPHSRNTTVPAHNTTPLPDHWPQTASLRFHHAVLSAATRWPNYLPQL